MTTDHNILAIYNQAYNRARQTGGGGRETPHQIAHIQALKAILAIGSGENGTIDMGETPLRVQPEDPAFAHQRRLKFCSHWLNQNGRRQSIAANPSFTNVTDAFAAGGVYERAYLAGESKAEDMAGPLLTDVENAVHVRLEAALGMEALLDDLHEIVGAADPMALVEAVSAMVEATKAQRAAAPVEEPAPAEHVAPVEQSAPPAETVAPQAPKDPTPPA